jgi:hypothetical protein
MRASRGRATISIAMERHGRLTPTEDDARDAGLADVN